MLTLVTSLNIIFQVWYYNVQEFASKGLARSYLAAIVFRIIVFALLTVYSTCSMMSHFK